MRTKHIAIFGCPYAAGVHPTLSIVATLIRRGYRVSYVTSDHFAQRVSELGAEVVLCPRFTDSSTDITDGGNQASPFLAILPPTLLSVTPFYESNRPALIIYDFLCLAGRILSTRWGIPAVQISPSFGFDKRHFSAQVTREEFRERILSDCRSADLELGRHGVVNGDFLFHRERLNVYFYPQLFQVEGTAFDERYFYAARCAAERPLRRTWKPANIDDRPIILVSSSTFFIRGAGYFKMCVEALSRFPWRIVLALGDGVDASSIIPIPQNVEIIQGVPQLEVLPYTNLLIFLGGMTSTMEAMYHGVPLLMISHGEPEAELCAENTARLGLGRHLKKEETSSEGIRDAAARILNDTALRNRVARMQYRVQREPGAEETVNKIAECLVPEPFGLHSGHGPAYGV